MPVFLGTLWSSIKQIKAAYIVDGEHAIFVHAMQGNRASSRVDLGYTEIFPIPVVTSVSFYTFDKVFGDSLEFHQANQGSLCV